MILNIVKRTSRTSLNFIQIACRNLNSKIPVLPVPSLTNEFTSTVKIERNTIALLERLSLVSFDTDEGLNILEDSIAFADKILHIDTDNVEPLYSVLEDQTLILREDKVTQGNCQKEILKNAAVTEDDYFVAPIGNIPLHEVEVQTESTKLKQNEN
ncbi:unnamed protein product [Spodoptera littoralis]|uniref:Glutamyl-tRNA(Gln) amidotransferase subunit C, mitochondrial n=2 Tax=Spodoptera TaxID=7106 RepID=A0A9P0IF23_SPOLI|nr:glutamyl-tRNA(Gln) amidotransferase subunit C, mitochondrial [Spodoptera litura]CAB3515688.1 unnamed protein product [Spodoptera littoralis]CAH1645554.1 unnamed protein product [Spodoptera littoralis]